MAVREITHEGWFQMNEILISNIDEARMLWSSPNLYIYWKFKIRVADPKQDIQIQSLFHKISNPGPD